MSSIYRLNGKEVTEEEFFHSGRHEFNEKCNAAPMTQHTHWPMKCDASGVHPSQIPEARAKAAQAGCPTEFTKDGRAILTSRKHRAQYHKSIGLHDRNGGYSDG